MQKWRLNLRWSPLFSRWFNPNDEIAGENEQTLWPRSVYPLLLLRSLFLSKLNWTRPALFSLFRLFLWIGKSLGSKWFDGKNMYAICSQRPEHAGKWISTDSIRHEVSSRWDEFYPDEFSSFGLFLFETKHFFAQRKVTVSSNYLDVIQMWEKSCNFFSIRFEWWKSIFGLYIQNKIEKLQVVFDLLLYLPIFDSSEAICIMCVHDRHVYQIEWASESVASLMKARSHTYTTCMHACTYHSLVCIHSDRCGWIIRWNDQIELQFSALKQNATQRRKIKQNPKRFKNIWIFYSVLIFS